MVLHKRKISDLYVCMIMIPDTDHTWSQLATKKCTYINLPVQDLSCMSVCLAVVTIVLKRLISIRYIQCHV